MDTSINKAAQLLKKHTKGVLTPEELEWLHKYMEELPRVQEKFEELSDPDCMWKRFWYQHDDELEPLPVFKQKMDIV